MTHVLAVLGLTISVILWYLIQPHPRGPEGEGGCGCRKSARESSACDGECEPGECAPSAGKSPL